MRVVALMENTTQDQNLTCAHGLSLYIQTPLHRILFDMGPNDAFIQNAQALGIDLAEVDIAILTHGHYDHAGGLDAFCRINSKAPIYIHPLAQGPYYGTSPTGDTRYIGMSDEAKSWQDRFIITGDEYQIDEELYLFSNVEGKDLLSSSNKALFEKTGQGFEPDSFNHEQNLVVTCEDKTALFSGCAHRGIVNILHAAQSHANNTLDYVFGGFHLSNPALGGSEPKELVDAVAAELIASKAECYTGHCTGSVAFEYLQQSMGEHIHALSTGFDKEF